MKNTIFYFLLVGGFFLLAAHSQDSQVVEVKETEENISPKYIKFSKLTLVEYEDENGEIWQTAHSETKKGDFSFDPNPDEPLLSVIRFRIETESLGQVNKAK